MNSEATNNTNVTSTAPKLYKMFRFFTFARLFFGLNYRPYYQKISKFNRIAVNLYCLTISISATAYVAKHKLLSYTPYIFVIIEYLSSVLYGIYNSEPLIFGSKVIQSLASIDQRLNLMDHCYDSIGLTHNIVAVCCIVFRLFYTSLYCFEFANVCLSDPLLVVVTNFIMLSVDVNQLSRIVIVAIIRYRMGILKNNIEKHFQVEFFMVRNDGKRIAELKKFLGIYRDILNYFDMSSKQVSALYMVNLICCFPKMMLVFYKLLLLGKHGTLGLFLLGIGLEGLQWSVVTCLPAVLAELISHEVDQIALLLLEKQVSCRDEKTKEEIGDFINYIQRRPFKYRLYRLVSIDMSLPVNLVSLCTTYIIVLVQFTHLFE